MGYRYMKSPPENRFWAKVRKTDGCWIWTGAPANKSGYGKLQVRPRSPGHRGEEYAHRFSYALHYGPIPEGLSVCHTCDNPPCVRPDHLFVASQAENWEDMRRKGRERKAQGEGHPRAILTEDQVVTIREHYAAGGTSQYKLAAQYGVAPETIAAIVYHRSWQHTPGPVAPPIGKGHQHRT